MQLRLPFTTAEPAAPHPGACWIAAGPERFAVFLVRMRRARRYIMRLRPDGALRVTIPRGGSRAEALRFAERHIGWAVRQRARQRVESAAAREWTDGTTVLLDGRGERLTIAPHPAGRAVTLGRLAAAIPHGADVRVEVQRALRALAVRELPPRLLELAAAHGLAVRRITIRDQRSRWGSCSSSGSIALNYRLVQMPPAVRDYILVHELAHLVHANHSRRFWRQVEAMCPEFRAAEQWLKTTGRTLF
jgi:predicted metal-dependent hydrolase